MKTARLKDVIQYSENKIFLGKNIDFKHKKLKDLTVKELGEMGLVFLESECINGIVPDNINLVLLAWKTLIKRVINLKMIVFEL